MGAQTKLKRSKCNHDDIESTLVLLDDEKTVGKLTMIRKAMLYEACKTCSSNRSFYVGGGLLFSAEYDNA
jgi:hypothetical protein